MKAHILNYGKLTASGFKALDVLVGMIRAEFTDSRFDIRQLSWHEIKQTKRTVFLSEINIQKVRLKQTKLYCGNHPSACELGNKEDKKHKYLEGADWVEFNDRLNDVFDQEEVSANIGQQVLLRRGRERCIEYHNGRKPTFGNYEWARVGTYADYCGQKAPRALFPEGTPGINHQQAYHVVG